jgi:hypothetical protein
MNIAPEQHYAGIATRRMAERLKAAVLKTDFTLPADRTIQRKSLCQPAVCTISDFTLAP